MPATGALIGTPASMSESVDEQTDAIDVEPFDASTSDDEAQRVGELLLARYDWQQRALREQPVADLATLGRAHPTDLAVRRRGHVVVVHVALVGVRTDRVEQLVHPRHAERADVEHLRLATLEQARAVRGGHDADLG